MAEGDSPGAHAILSNEGEEMVFERGSIFIVVTAPQSNFSFVPNAGDLGELPAYDRHHRARRQ